MRKFKVLIIAVVVVIALTTAILMLTVHPNSSDSEVKTEETEITTEIMTEESQSQDMGLFRNQDEAVFSEENDELSDEYMSRPDYTNDLISEIKKTVLQKASSGSFSELDMYLNEVASKYKMVPENEDITYNIEYYIECVQSDIARFISIQNGEGELLYFLTPEMATAAFVYLPISKKIDMVIHLQSRIYPTVTKNNLVDLKDITPEEVEKREFIKELNFTQTNDKITDCRIYLCNIYKRECQITTVQQESSFVWKIYRMDFVDEEKDNPINVKFMKEAKEQAEMTNQDFSYDSFFVPEE